MTYATLRASKNAKVDDVNSGVSVESKLDALDRVAAGKLGRTQAAVGGGDEVGGGIVFRGDFERGQPALSVRSVESGNAEIDHGLTLSSTWRARRTASLREQSLHNIASRLSLTR